MTNFSNLEQIQDLDFWSKMNPELTISEDWSTNLDLIKINTQNLNEILHDP